MTASKNSSQDGESVTTEQSDEQISQGADWVKSEYDRIETAGPVVEMMAIPDHGEIVIEGHRIEGTDERYVNMDIRTSREEPNASIRQVLSPEKAEKIGKQLVAAAQVASDESDTVGATKTDEGDEVGK